MDLFIWFFVLAVALFVLVKGADYFVEGAQQLGASLGMSAFAIGVLIVGFGTSLPELASSIAAVLEGTTEIVIANVVGSNIANILLVVGLLAAVGGKIVIKRDLIRTELPIFFIATVHFVLIIYDGVVDRIEGLLLLGTFGAYMWYLFQEAADEDRVKLVNKGRKEHLKPSTLVYLVGGVVAVIVGAKYTIDAVTTIALGFSVPVDLVSITAIAIGTSLPELFVTVRAAQKGQGELALGNVFGSNAFNILMVAGLPAFFTPLVVGGVVLSVGLPVLVAASLIFFVNGLARQLMRWEGMMMLLFFLFFMVKLFGAL